MIKKEYTAPDAEVLTFALSDVLAASQIEHDPQDPVCQRC